MIIAVIIMGLIILRIIVLVNQIHTSNTGDISCGLFFGLLLSILIVIEVALIIDITQTPKPGAMDVYQGKTTLEYTIRDGVKVDSVIVFKENDYGKQD